MLAPIPGLSPVPEVPDLPRVTPPSASFDEASQPLYVLGQTAFRRRRERFGLHPADRLRHLHVIGKTGSGKSTLLANLISQDLAAGRGLALLDPHGELVETVLRLVPSHRLGDVLLFAPEDEAWPVSFNVFRAGRRPHPSRTLLASELLSAFRSLWSDSWGPRLEHVLRQAILAVAEGPDASLVYLYRFLTDEALREKTLERVTDPAVLAFWQEEFPGYGKSLQAEAVAPVLNKLGTFVGNPIVRSIVGQVRSRVDFADLIDRQAIVLANLSTGGIGEDASRLLGALLLSSIQLAAWSRGRAQPPFFVYIDEFQRFVSGSIATMLSESRTFGRVLVLAHQYFGQLSDQIRDAVVGNVGSSLVFRLGAEDAQYLGPGFEPTLTASHLRDLPAHHAAVRLLAEGQELAPLTARMLPPRTPPPGGRERADLIRRLSRERFARRRDELFPELGV